MTKRKILGVIRKYEWYFKGRGIHAKRFPDKRKPDSEIDVLAHCLSMLPQMKEFLDDGRTDKVFRWLGFIQGCLWVLKIYTLNDLKNHNRPPAILLRKEPSDF